MPISKVKLLDVPKTRGKPTLPDDVFARFQKLFAPLITKRGGGSELAVQVGLTPAAISQWKTGKNRPTFHNAVAALRFLGCSDEQIATVLGADPRFFSTPEGPRNLAAALGVAEDLLATLWADGSIGEEMMRYEEKFRRAALALMHSEGCTLQEAMAAVSEAHTALARNKDSAEWGALKWADVASGYVVKQSKSGERPSVRLKKSGEG